MQMRGHIKTPWCPTSPATNIHKSKLNDIRFSPFVENNSFGILTCQISLASPHNPSSSKVHTQCPLMTVSRFCPMNVLGPFWPETLQKVVCSPFFSGICKRWPGVRAYYHCSQNKYESTVDVCSH